KIIANVGQNSFKKYFESFLEAAKKWGEAKTIKDYIKYYFHMKILNKSIEHAAVYVYNKLEELKKNDPDTFKHTIEKDEWAKKAYYLGKRITEEESKSILEKIAKKVFD
ncbi:MAG: hypothetical protein QXY64_04020, partial [Candidatus Bilamarchaeaceae archaeon]